MYWGVGDDGHDGLTRGFDELYGASYPSVWRVARLLVPTAEDAHDVAQEAYARALARWDAVHALDDPAAWVRHVAVNAALDAGRRTRGRDRAYRRWFGRGEDQREPDGTSVDVVRGLRSLSPHHRQALVLHYLLDLSVAEIAAETGRPVGTVKADLSRGRAALALVLRRKGTVTLDV